PSARAARAGAVRSGVAARPRPWGTRAPLPRRPVLVRHRVGAGRRRRDSQDAAGTGAAAAPGPDGRGGRGVKISTPPAAASAVAPELAELVEAVTSRLKAGGAIDLDAFLREHPAHADELRRLLPAMKLLASLSGPGPDAVADAGLSAAEPLGDYRLVREV